ncbi:MoaD/ThiS family protein [Geobacter sp.]|uniref:MoaD/ThiS family protein n=1 Tax=Geobacter sp. TaxID=46610 RepID=UPI002612B0B5|nr:MoaD/ThiS family protein [Geobacter sp.]
MNAHTNTTVRMFGALHTFRKERGLEPKTEVSIPPEGRTARELARELGLPIKKIEAVFINHVVYGLDHLIQPGDRVAFVPTGIPGHVRLLLGIYGAGRQSAA